MPRLQVLRPDDVLAGRDPSPSSFQLQFLAQGDSWFSFGAFPPFATSNLFDGIATTLGGCAINCARPGARLAHMADTTRDRIFLRFLNGPDARRWAGLLLSGGGNDLVDAVTVSPDEPADRRLLATPAERDGTTARGGERYLSNAGWQTFAIHLQAVFATLLAARDRGLNRGIPVVLHDYDVSVPRPAGAGLGDGPWLAPAMRAYGIPAEDWEAVARTLLRRLSVLLDHLAATTADGSVHVVHTQGTLRPARPDDTGVTVDWQNEIHPTRGGYARLGAAWQAVLDGVTST